MEEWQERERAGWETCTGCGVAMGKEKILKGKNPGRETVRDLLVAFIG